MVLFIFISLHFRDNANLVTLQFSAQGFSLFLELYSCLNNLISVYLGDKNNIGLTTKT
jgi:hypothetical protein